MNEETPIQPGIQALPQVETITDYQVLLAVVPELENRIRNKEDEFVKELIRRAVKCSNGFRPFHWMQGCM